MLTETGFPASRLEIEITEASLLEDREQVITIIKSLKNLGVSVSLDDFGTGYASLAQVNSLPIDRIKIDKSFISTIVKSDQTAAIVATITNLGHTLNVPITAEGVESEQIRSALEAVRLLRSAGLAVRPRGVRRQRAHLPRPEGARRLSAGFAQRRRRRRPPLHPSNKPQVAIGTSAAARRCASSAR